MSAGKYDAAVADAQRAQSERDATRQELGTARADAKRKLELKQAELDELNQVISCAQVRCRRIAGELGLSGTGAAGCSQALDDATALNQQLRAHAQG